MASRQTQSQADVEITDHSPSVTVSIFGALAEILSQTTESSKNSNLSSTNQISTFPPSSTTTSTPSTTTSTTTTTTTTTTVSPISLIKEYNLKVQASASSLLPVARTLPASTYNVHKSTENSSNSAIVMVRSVQSKNGAKFNLTAQKSLPMSLPDISLNRIYTTDRPVFQTTAFTRADAQTQIYPVYMTTTDLDLTSQALQDDDGGMETTTTRVPSTTTPYEQVSDVENRVVAVDTNTEQNDIFTFSPVLTDTPFKFAPLTESTTELSNDISFAPTTTEQPPPTFSTKTFKKYPHQNEFTLLIASVKSFEPPPITSLRPMATRKRSRDYVIYGILSNNSVAIKYPVEDETPATPDSARLVYGILQNGTVVRKYPNGTVHAADVNNRARNIHVTNFKAPQLRNPNSLLFQRNFIEENYVVPKINTQKSQPVNSDNQQQITTSTTDTPQMVLFQSFCNINVIFSGFHGFFPTLWWW